MFVKKTLLVIIFNCILLLAACGQAPAVSVSLIPSAEQLSTETAAGLFSGPYDDGRLPMSVPEISEADKKVFNPDRIFDYLATSPDAYHDYYIVGAEVKEDKLYLTVRDEGYFNPVDAYCYIKDAFALTDEEILSLPVFAKCQVDEDDWLTDDSSLDYTGYETSKLFESIPVADNAIIYLPQEYNADEISVQDFIDMFLKDKSKNDKIDIGLVSFDYKDGQITGVYDNNEYPEEDEDDYEGSDNAEEYDNEDIVCTQYAGNDEWELLPGSVPEISDADLKTFNPKNAENYLAFIAEHYYSLESAELKDGVVYLTIQDGRYLDDINSAYDFFKDRFSLSDGEILDLPKFSGCLIRDDVMYVNAEAWKEANDAGYFEDTNYFDINNVLLKPFPLSKDARITLYNEDTCEQYKVSYDEFVKMILGGKSKNNKIGFYCDMSFKYEDGKITAVYQYDENEAGDYEGEDDYEDEGDYE